MARTDTQLFGVGSRPAAGRGNGRNGGRGRHLARVRIAGLVLAAAGAWSASAPAVTDPQALVEKTTEQVLNALRADQERYKADRSRLFSLVREIILPHFDFEQMSQRVLGRYWRTASAEQKQEFIEQFRTLLVRTYSTALADYSDARIDYLPVRVRDEGRDVTVRTEVEVAGAPPVSIEYSMRLRDDGWKVYDVSIEGVSLVITYRTSFANEIRSNGLDSLVQRLARLNEQARQ